MRGQTIIETKISDVKFLKKGKVRELYDLDDKYLMVATDRISCFDVVLPTPIPQKGRVLTQISLFWFDYTKDIIPNHLISSDIKDFPAVLQKHEPELFGRSLLVKKASPLPFECIVRGYLSGSGWKEYCKTQTVCGIKLPAGLKESDKLAEPIFTPSTKAEEGHDVNVDQAFVEKTLGKVLADKVKTVSIALYKRASEYAESRGIIIADTKFEFGTLSDGKLILIDEVLTPDSSRFWPKDQYKAGGAQPSFDKQFVRDYLETLDWGKVYPGPELPENIVRKTTEKYVQAYNLMTGITLD